MSPIVTLYTKRFCQRWCPTCTLGPLVDEATPQGSSTKELMSLGAIYDKHLKPEYLCAWKPNPKPIYLQPSLLRKLHPKPFTLVPRPLEPRPKPNSLSPQITNLGRRKVQRILDQIPCTINPEPHKLQGLRAQGARFGD